MKLNLNNVLKKWVEKTPNAPAVFYNQWYCYKDFDTLVRKTAQYFQSENADKPIKEVLLSGGSAYLPSLVGYMANTFAIPVSIGNPFENFSLASGVKLSEQTSSFSVAAGLAIKEG